MADDATQDNQPRGRCSLTDLVADLEDPAHRRMTGRMLTKAIRAGYIDIFAPDYAATRRAAEKLRDSPDPRASAVGTRLCWAMAVHDARLIALVDKAERLDGGDPTGITKHTGSVTMAHVRSDIDRMLSNPAAMEAATAMRLALEAAPPTPGSNGNGNGHH